MQRQIKSYQSKKKQWAAEIYLELDKERVKFRDFIKLIKNENEREKVYWIANDLQNLNPELLKE